jgi:hypothetical protein
VALCSEAIVTSLPDRRFQLVLMWSAIASIQRAPGARAMALLAMSPTRTSRPHSRKAPRGDKPGRAVGHRHEGDDQRHHLGRQEGTVARRGSVDDVDALGCADLDGQRKAAVVQAEPVGSEGISAVDMDVLHKPLSSCHAAAESMISGSG